MRTATTAENAEQDDLETAIDRMDVQIQRVDVTAAAAINKSEVEAQIDAAHRHRRSIKQFLVEAKSIATVTKEVAEACIYAVPRGGKPITGPSVRLAEICASAYGNMHNGSRVIDVEEKVVVAQGVSWDIEKNVRYSVETRRSIVDKRGKRYNDDMITMTGNAAGSIALRNAIFRAIPRAYVDLVYNAARAVAVGDAKTLDARRTEVVVRLEKIGVPRERIFARLGKAGLEDITLDDLETMLGLGTAIKNGDLAIDDAFPPLTVVPATATTAAPEGQRVSLRKEPEKPAPKQEEGPAGTDAVNVDEVALLTEQINEAATLPDLMTVGGHIGDAKPRLGDAKHKILLAAYRVRYAALGGK